MVKVRPLIGSTVMPKGIHAPLYMTLVRYPPQADVLTPANTCSRVNLGTRLAASCTAS